LSGRRRYKGFSLIEVTVYLTLLILIMGGAMAIMLLANCFFGSTLDNNAVQRDAQATMMRLSRELEESKEDQVLFSEDGEPKGVIFISPRDEAGEFEYDFSGEGRLMWQKWICYFVEENGGKLKLLRTETPIMPTTEPTPTTWTTSHFQAIHKREVVSHELLAFEIVPDSTIENTYNVSASFGREGHTHRTDGDRVAERVEIENSVHLRN